MTLVGFAVAAALASGCDIEAESRSAEGSFDRTVKVTGPVDLDIVSRSGRIDVRVGDGDAVRSSAGFTPTGRFRAGRLHTRRTGQILASSPPIEQSGSAVSVGDIRDPVLGSNVSISYEVTVPPDTRLRTTSRSGDQKIESIRGPVVASSRSGSIQIGQVAGNVEIETRSGHVDVRLPSDGASLDIETRSGAIDSDVPIRMDRGRARRHVSATIGRGDRRVDVHTRSGSVRIRYGLLLVYRRDRRDRFREFAAIPGLTTPSGRARSTKAVETRMVERNHRDHRGPRESSLFAR
jgi:hypothetical protein